jgi:hypothetical protein
MGVALLIVAESAFPMMRVRIPGKSFHRHWDLGALWALRPLGFPNRQAA